MTLQRAVILGALCCLQLLPRSVAAAADGIDQELFGKMKCVKKYSCSPIYFNSSGYNLSAWLYVPAEATEASPVPAVVMANGYSLLKEQYMGIPAASFLESCRSVVLLFDFRKIGASSGWPRSEVIPHEQLDDFVNAITFARNLSYVDSSKIGIWGISMTGGHVLQLASWWGQNLGIKAAVAVVPSVRVAFTADLLFTAQGVNGFFRPLMGRKRQELYESNGDMYKQFSTEWGEKLSTQYFPTVSKDCDKNFNCFFTVKPSYEWFMNASAFKPEGCTDKSCMWANYTSFSSIMSVLQYFPVNSAGMSQVATLQLTAEKDPFFPPPQQQWAYSRLQSPTKKIVTFPGATHFDLYPAFAYASQTSKDATAEAIAWFNKYLSSDYPSGAPLSQWPSSDGSCGQGTTFSLQSMTCEGDLPPASNKCDGSGTSSTEILAWTLMSIFLVLFVGHVLLARGHADGLKRLICGEDASGNYRQSV